MGQKGSLSREQAVAFAGQTAVIAVEHLACTPTNRIGFKGAKAGDRLTEWSACVHGLDADGRGVCLMAYYYTSHEQDAQLAEAPSAASLVGWSIAGFEISVLGHADTTTKPGYGAHAG